MRKTKRRWNRVLAGLIALGSTAVTNAKVIFLSDGLADASGMLPAAYDTRLEQPLPAASGPQSFRELSGESVHARADDHHGSDAPSLTTSARPSGMRVADTAMIMLTIGTLVAYQLRKKQRLLEKSPFFV